MKTWSRRDPAKEQYWREAVARYQSSGLSMNQFCLQEKINHHTFSSWKYIIRARDKQLSSNSIEAKQPRKKQTKHVGFVPLVVSDKHCTMSKEKPVGEIAVAEIIIADCRIRIFAGVDVSTFRTLLQAIKE